MQKTSTTKESSARLLQRKITIIFLGLILASFLYSFYLFSTHAKKLIVTRPEKGTYRSDEFIFLRIFYLVSDNMPYYIAYKDAVENDVRDIVLTKDVLLWRMPTIFYIWKLLGRNAFGIGVMFIALATASLVSSERLIARFVPVPFSWVAPIFLFPYFMDAYIYGTSFLFTEWWGWFFFLFGVTFYVWEKKSVAWIFLLLALFVRELFILPILGIFFIALISKRHQNFFASLLFIFIVFYLFHIFMVLQQNVPEGHLGFSRVHVFDASVFQKQIAFSMRQYPLLFLKLPLTFILITTGSLIYLILRYRKTSKMYGFMILASMIVSVFLLPFVSDAYHDYWGIVVMPTIILLSPLSILVVNDLRTKRIQHV